VKSLATVTAPLSSRDFHETYWAPREPVVIRGAADAFIERHERWKPIALVIKRFP